MYGEAQKLLLAQREGIEHLRTENSRMRLQLQAVQESKQQSGSQKEKYNSTVNQLMSLKFQLEEQVEKGLEQLDSLRKAKKTRHKEVHDGMRKDRGPSQFGDRDLTEVLMREERNIEHYQTRYNEILHHNKALRALIDELRRDRLNLNGTMERNYEILESKSQEIIQLINIANEYYSERAMMRLIYSEMLTDDGKDSEGHRQAVAELNNRVEYFDQLMVEREEDFKQALVDAEYKATKGKDVGEEQREAERRRQQTLIDAFDHLMHGIGVWDATELVDRFLQKEEKFEVQYRYLDALNADAAKLEGRIKEINARAAAMKVDNPVDDTEVVKLKQRIKDVNDRGDVFARLYAEASDELEKVRAILGQTRRRMSRCRLLSSFKPAKRRWALVRSNLRHIVAMAQKKKLVKFGGKGEGPGVVTGSPQNAYDPRRRMVQEEIGDLDIAPVALYCIGELSVLEEATLRLLSYKKLKLEPQLKRRQGIRLSLAMKALNHSKGIGDVQTTIKTGEVLGGPRFSTQPQRGRAEMLVIPNLKDIDSPRSADGALSPREILDTVRNAGFSERVAEKLKKEIVKRMPAHSTHGSAAGKTDSKKGENLADVVLGALKRNKALSAQGKIYDPYSEEEQANAPPRLDPSVKAAQSSTMRRASIAPGGPGTMTMRRGSMRKTDGASPVGALAKGGSGSGKPRTGGRKTLDDSSGRRGMMEGITEI